jgi:UDP-N-acetylmuramoylalanine--D-glutamate ligase
MMKSMVKREKLFRAGIAPELAGRRVLVVGAAKTGVATANFLLGRGAVVTVTDRRDAGSLDAYLAGLHPRVELELGGHRQETFLSRDLIVPSPGVPMDDPLLATARGVGVPILSEIELAYRFLPVPLVAVTGTNGKSTTVTALGKVFEEAGISVCVGGNLGNPLIGEVDGLKTAQMVVAEISSFQLEWIESFRPRVAAILNVSEDHLDRYRSFEEYLRVKERIFENQEPEDHLVLNGDDHLVREAGTRASSSKVWFSRRTIPLQGVYLFRGWIYSRLGRGTGRKIMPVSEMLITGEHNWENALAVTAMALLGGASPADVRRALGRFEGLPHRTQFVREKDGVRFYDDSKGTNVGAAARTLSGFQSPVVLIAGGRDKGGSYAPLFPLVREHARCLVLTGEASGRMARELEGAAPIVRAGDMAVAVREAAAAARPGDTVLLSPACSSFDQYQDYVQRGRHFQDEVRKL